MPTIRPRQLVFLLIILGPVLLFAPMFIGGEVLFWGTPILQFVPWHRYALEIVQAGHLPLWNPLLGTGAPLLANYQSALLYPPNMILWMFGPEYGHGYLVVLHLIAAGVGMALVARKLDIGFFGQCIAGLSFSLSGYMVARAGFISINHAAAWLPWIILFTDRILAQMEQQPPLRASLPSILGLTLALTLQWLAGHAQTSWYSLLLVSGWSLWRFSQDRRWSGVLWGFARLLLAGGLALLVCAAQLLPTMEYLALSQRGSSLDRELALTYSFWPWRFLGFFLPDLFGNPASGDYWGYGNYWEDAIYLGILPFLFALGTIWRGIRKSSQNSIDRFLLITSFISIILALGKNTPIFTFLFDHMPTFNLFQAPTRWNLLLIFSLSLLAARGGEAWSTPKDRALYWTRLLTAGAGIIGVASYVGLLLLPDVEPTFIRSFARGGILLTVAGLLTLFLPKERIRLKLGLVGGFILLDLVVAGQGLNPSLEPSVFEGNVLRSRGVEAEGRVYMPLALEQRLKFEETHRFDTFDPGIDWIQVREVALPNTTMLEGVPSVNNFDPILPERYMTYLDALEIMDTARREQHLSWLGVSYQILSHPEAEHDVLFSAIQHDGGVHLVEQAIFVESLEQALDIVSLDDFDIEHQVVLESEPYMPAWSGGDGQILSIEQRGPTEVDIQVLAPDGGWLTLADTWYPGWEAMVDGAKVPIYQANVNFKAVEITPGEHRVSFMYQPLSFTVGVILSLLGVSCIGLISFACIRKN